MNCNICGKPIILVPSAQERAKKYGGTAAEYTALFTSHPECYIAKRNRETVELMRKICSHSGSGRSAQNG